VIAFIAYEKPTHSVIAQSAMAIEDDEQPVANAFEIIHTKPDGISGA